MRPNNETAFHRFTSALQRQRIAQRSSLVVLWRLDELREKAAEKTDLRCRELRIIFTAFLSLFGKTAALGCETRASAGIVAAFQPRFEFLDVNTEYSVVAGRLSVSRPAKFADIYL
jgi:hypothetical protein